MGGIVPILGAIGSILGGVAAIVTAFRPPKISFPEVKIPQADLDAINKAIESNKELSEQARQAINQAISNYQQGKLTPQYQALLDEWWDKTSKQLAQRLAAMGLSNSTMAVSAWQELQRAYLANQANLLTRQLQEALSLTGLSQQYINDLMNKVSLQLRAGVANAQNQLMAAQLSQNLAAQRGQAFAGLGEAITGLGPAFETIGKVFTRSKDSDKASKSSATDLKLPYIVWSGKLGEPAKIEWR